MKKQVYNPFLPLHEYIPDGEPHVFDGRVYHYGSHDKEGGYTFCMLDYVVYSAPVEDLTDWRYEGVSYRACQDPDYKEKNYMYAPDVVRGNDRRYYLYYCMAGEYGYNGYTGPISVAVSDSPAGPFEYYGHVHYKDGSLMKKYVCFDPAVLNDEGTIRLYYGTSYEYEELADFAENPEYLRSEEEMFGRTAEEILAYRRQPESCPDVWNGRNAALIPVETDSIMGACMAVLEEDMLTVKDGPRHILPYRVKGTGFEAHPFFEGSSMRKVGNKYYFIYSSRQNHELCYAASDYPDRGFAFGGTIVSNGDIGYEGRTDAEKHNMTGTTHGSIIEINGQWYVFYHRLTHKSDYSRQACAEKIVIREDGFIPQVEVTSCGLNGRPLSASGGETYPAVIACILTNGHMPHGSNSIYNRSFPNVTNCGEERFIGEIGEGTVIGYKYFDFQEITGLRLCLRRETKENRVEYAGPLRIDERCEQDDRRLQTPYEDSGQGGTNARQEQTAACRDYFEIRLQETGECIARTDIPESEQWQEQRIGVSIPDGTHALYLVYHGEHTCQLKEIGFER